VWHVFYLRTRNGRVFWKGMLPNFGDAKQAWEMTLFNLERRSERPKFGRFSYVEKAESWALLWGTVIMVITGFFLWFDNLAVQIFPKGFLDVMLIIHFYEAWLATLAIAVWHLYSTILSPGVYPGNPAWITGKMPRHMYEDEHPLDDAIKEVTPEDQDVYTDTGDRKHAAPGKGTEKKPQPTEDGKV
jgi:cytochrome b subunit of formate dehydrogenase